MTLHSLRFLIKKKSIFIFAATLLILGIVIIASFSEIRSLQSERQQLLTLSRDQSSKIASLSARIKNLENEDLRVTNEAIKATVSATHNSYQAYAVLLEKMSDAKVQKINVSTSEAELPKIVRLLSDTNWVDAQKKITGVRQSVDKAISENQAKLAAVAVPAAPASQTLQEGEGFFSQAVQTDQGSFVVSYIVSNLSSTRVLTDSASENDCVNNGCSTKSLADYVSVNGGFAGINGSYFCPPDYARCADKAGQFDTLLFNSRLKKYINSDNNKFSTVPMFVQTADHGMRFMGQTVEWGRDTGIIGGLANNVMLVSGGKPATGDTGGGGRNFIGTKSGKVYIGHVYSTSFATAAKTLATLGMESALNLDTGGSTALMYNGRYILGPGRLLPNAIILAR